MARNRMPRVDLWADGVQPSLQRIQLKKAEAMQAAGIDQEVVGEKIQHPVDLQLVEDLQVYNEYHVNCLHTKTEACVGLGFKEEKVEKELTAICAGSANLTMRAMGFDYFEKNGGVLEVVRRDGDKITGIHPRYMKKTWIVRLNEEQRKSSGIQDYFVVLDKYGVEHNLPRFGEKEQFMSLEELKGERADEDISEIIHFPKSLHGNDAYGNIDWLAACAKIDLGRELTQYEFDLFRNRAVPAALLLLTGALIGNDEWKVVEGIFDESQGDGNAGRAAAINLQEEVRGELFKLAAELQEGAFGERMESIGQGVVTAHRVPPILAGIQIPGRLGATNEMANASVTFQLFVVGPAQRTITSILDKTLGNQALNGGLGLRAGDFELKTLTEEIAPQMMDTMSRMRTQVTTPEGQARDLNGGVRQ